MDGEFDANEMFVGIHETRKSNSDRCQADKAVQNCHELRHLRHLHASCEHNADAAADQKRQQQNFVVPLNDAKHGRK